jgi:hypothetical protein
MLSLAPSQGVSGVTTLTLNVNTADDGRDFATNSVCSVGAPTGGPCTIRAAISEAWMNIEHSSNTVINIPSGNYVLTIPPDSTNDVHSGDLNIPSTSSTNTITINGIGDEPAVIDANQLDRVFDIGYGVNITFNNVVIRGGYLAATESGINGAGIRNEGNLTLDHVVIKDNVLECGLESCDFWMYGGGLYNGGGTVDISASSIRQNTSPDSSAIYHTTTTMNIDHSDISNNNSTHAYTIQNYGNLNIKNSTIAGNTSVFFSGIENYGALSIASSTFANPGILGAIGGFGGSVTIVNTILMSVPNLAGTNYNCFLQGVQEWLSLGHNIFSDDSCPGEGTGDLINTDPKLGVLGFWGGPTRTMPLTGDSPAIDHCDGVCLDTFGVLVFDDQRFISRSDGLCDTGAYEGFIVINQIFLPLIVK